MTLSDVLRVVIKQRSERDIVVTTMSAAREWPKLAKHPLDFHYIPSTMGGGMALGLGLALAQPRREVLVLTGDGSLLMNLGSLVTVVDAAAENLTVAVLDNTVYEVTGGQQTAAASAMTDYAGLARSAGFANVAQFCDVSDLRQRLPGILHKRGPRFLWLLVESTRENFQLDAPGPIAERLKRFTEALKAS
jgi:thiamine pyrophosphate-dependent acetolactate synthase large subunit-like protein